MNPATDMKLEIMISFNPKFALSLSSVFFIVPLQIVMNLCIINRGNSAANELNAHTINMR